MLRARALPSWLSRSSFASASAFASAAVVLAVACSSTSLLASCSSSSDGAGGKADAGADGAPGTGNTPREVTTLFAKSVKNVTIEFDYAAGAEPYFGSLEKFGDPWGLFRTTTVALFEGKKAVSYPKSLAAMEKLDDVPAKDLSNAEILQIAETHRSARAGDGAAAFYVLFVNGFWVDDTGTARPEILSVSIGSTGVIAMFKPAIATPATNPTPALPLVEQVALAHAFGHAVGFVDDGIPVGEANRAHVDTENPHHCTNPSCAMSFAVETAAGAAAYVKASVRNPEVPLYGQECLSDARILENQQIDQ